jgi:uncharacterized lipoprotein YmbA
MKNLVRLALLVILGVTLGACAATQPPAYYLLEAAPGITTHKGSRQPCMVIGMRPIRIPSYIDRPQIMVRTGKNELAISEFNQWAEPLDVGIARVVSRNLVSLTCADVVSVLPAGRSGPVDYLLNIRLAGLEGSLGGEAVLEAEWSLSEGETRQMILSSRSRFVKPVDGKDHASLVSAHSDLIADLSREIARAITTLQPNPGRQ